MKKVFFTVGPSQLYPTVPKHIKKALTEDIASISHRSEQFKQIYKAAVENIKNLLEVPDTHHIYFTASALEGMERTIQNTAKKYTFHFVNGSFSREFYQIATDLKKQALRFDAPNGEGFDIKNVVVPKKTELICFVQNETSTGVSTPLEDIYTIAKKYPQSLVAVDVVSSIPYIKLDFSLIDIALFSVQKGFGLPAGLGVLIVSDRALKKAQALAQSEVSIGSYHNFLKLEEFGQKFQTRETPNVLTIYLLAKVTEDMLKKGITTVRQETDKKASILYTFFEKHKHYTPFTKPPYRSQTTIVIQVKGESEKIVKQAAKHGFVIAQGYGKRKDDHIRIANFPSQTLRQVRQLLKVIT